MRLPGIFLFLLLTSPIVAASDRTALIIDNGDDLIARESKEILAAHHFRVDYQKGLDTKEMESAFHQFSLRSATNGIGVIVFAGKGVAVEQRENQETVRLQGLLSTDGDIKDRKSIQRHAFTILKMKDRMLKNLGSREVRVFLFCEEAGGIRPSDLPENWKVAFVDSTADLKKALPPAGQSRFFDSKTIQKGKLPGQQWVDEWGMVFCWCPPGKFTMGDEKFDDAKPVAVEIFRGFWMAKYEFTQRDWYQIKKRDPSSKVVFRHPLAPMVQVKQHEILSTLKRFNESERKAKRLPKGWKYSLPTEAEWEYACRSGRSESSSVPLEKLANFADKCLLRDQPTAHWSSSTQNDGVGVRPSVVGRYLPNAWGIHDLLGNVNEWTSSTYFPELIGGRDPSTAGREKETQERVFRGGSWCSPAEYCHPAFRNFTAANANSQTDNFTGFRIVLKQE